MRPEGSNFGNVGRYTRRIKDPERCAGCLALVNALIPSDGKAKTEFVRGLVLEYLETRHEAKCPTCGAKFRYCTYKLAEVQNGYRSSEATG